MSEKRLTAEFQDSIERGREALRRASEAEGRDFFAPRLPSREAGAAAASAAAASPIPSGLHPFFRGLLDTLPEPGEGWSLADREQWLETARNIFALIYKDPGGERGQPLRAIHTERPIPGLQSEPPERTA